MGKIAGSYRPPATVVLGALPVAPADRRQLRRLLQNLIANALKFVPPGPGADMRFTQPAQARHRPEPAASFAQRDGGCRIPKSSARGAKLLLGECRRVRTSGCTTLLCTTVDLLRAPVHGGEDRQWASLARLSSGVCRHREVAWVLPKPAADFDRIPDKVIIKLQGAMANPGLPSNRWTPTDTLFRGP